MSGHSKWSTIKRQKGANDAKRGALFTKVAREISVAARQGGPDPDANYRLRLAIEKARSVNMPADNIKRTIEKATGGGDAEQFEEIVYEGYGPGGVAVLVRCLTSNRNRAAQDVRSMFNGNGGKMAEPGSVAWMFETKGVVVVTKDSMSEEDAFLVAVDAGAEDVRTSDESIEVVTPPDKVKAVQDALAEAGAEVESADLTEVPKTTIAVEGNDAKKVLNLVDALEELDDVQDVYANFDISDDVLATLAS
jgi:YebC/PmpR family DNA-binding regulatory protein